MKLNDLNSLSDPEMVAQYILELRGTGTMLPYNELLVIQNWLKAAPDVERLLLILSDLLPDYYDREKGGSPRKSLSGISKIILLKLNDSK